ncbi:hypothetical protein [Mesorhizobium sp. M7A.F.Ca.CA.002.12.1.1]|uniref:hypothetical protein n=1 Tax=Mesorhizobium sp. M7A.F.Ca.CA.002.12.1.1 TaxID=2496735 RepID=UPI000FCAF077|nr:hypothetical protein [Mesorhizobium sp. M7A.F.Ca.CA.002.12.1.1]RUX60171.1 hypothetical protein EN989_11180 [Mesorhizobium sp. M7A.F.Ca.CA.002.12.1.1]
MKRSWIISIMLLAGCASNTGPQPTFISGNYYMGGDSECAFYKVHPTNNKIFCYNSNRQPIGERSPLTPAQIAMYQQIQAQKQSSDDQFYSNLSAGNRALAGAKSPTMPAPRVTPLERPGGSQMRCIGVGIYANCKTY